MSKRIVVTGGRDFADEAFCFDRLDYVHRTRGVSLLIEGEASGLDKMARRWAESRGVPVLPFPADWDNITRPGAVVRKRRDGKLYDAAAGGLRNQQMIDEGKPEGAVAFPGGSGTADMVGRLHRAKIRVWDLRKPKPSSPSAPA